MSCLSILPLVGDKAAASRRVQAEYGAVLTVVYGGVEVRRVNTDAWLPLPISAVMPISAGDSLRTDVEGRAYLTFGEAETLLLPGTTYTLERYGEESDGAIRVEARLIGRSVHRFPPGSLSLYQIRTPEGIAQFTGEADDAASGGAHFSIESNLTAPATTYITVAEGEALINDELMLQAEEGARLTAAEISAAIPLTLPYSAAQVEGRLEGCPGLILNGDPVDFRVRSGPSSEYYAMGWIEDGVEVQVMGFAGDGGFRWYRLQFQGQFGWVIGRVVQAECADLPQFPFGSTQESRYPVDEWEAFEVDLLSPFYGGLENTWFFRPRGG